MIYMNLYRYITKKNKQHKNNNIKKEKINLYHDQFHFNINMDHLINEFIIFLLLLLLLFYGFINRQNRLIIIFMIINIFVIIIIFIKTILLVFHVAILKLMLMLFQCLETKTKKK